MNFSSKFIYFHSRKCSWKCSLGKFGLGLNELTHLPMRDILKSGTGLSSIWPGIDLCKATSHNLNHCCTIPVAKGHHLLLRLKFMLPCRMLMPLWKPSLLWSSGNATMPPTGSGSCISCWRMDAATKKSSVPCRFVRIPAATQSNGFSVTGATAGTTAAAFLLKWTSQRSSSAHVAL